MIINGREESFVVRDSTKERARQPAPRRFASVARVIAFQISRPLIQRAKVGPARIGDRIIGEYCVVAFAWRRDMFDGLTEREREILALVGFGLGNKGIAYRLGIGHGTVKKHFVSINKKLGVVSRAELARLAAIALPALDPRSKPRGPEERGSAGAP